MNTPSLPTATIPLHPDIPPIMYFLPPNATIPLHHIILPIPTIPTPLNPDIVQCIETGVARMRNLTLTVNTLQAKNENMKAELTENLKKKALLSEKEKTTDMITAATLASDTTTSTSNKRVGIRGDRPITVSTIDNRRAAAPSGIDVVYGNKIFFITPKGTITLDSVKIVTPRNRRRRVVK